MEDDRSANRRVIALASVLMAVRACSVFGQANVVDINAPWVSPIEGCLSKLSISPGELRRLAPNDYARIQPLVSGLFGGLGIRDASVRVNLAPLVEYLKRQEAVRRARFTSLNLGERKEILVRGIRVTAKMAGIRANALMRSVGTEAGASRLDQLAENLDFERHEYLWYLTPETANRMTKAAAVARRRAKETLESDADEMAKVLSPETEGAIGGSDNALLPNKTKSDSSKNILKFPKQSNTLGPSFDDAVVGQDILPGVQNASEFLKGMDPGATAHDLYIQALEEEAANEGVWSLSRQQPVLDLYSRVIKLDPQHAPAHINRGTINYNLQRFDEAETDYRAAIEIDPQYALAYFDLGSVLDEKGRTTDAIEAFKGALALAPTYADAHYNLALAYERLKEPRKALFHWKAYVKLDPASVWTIHAKKQIFRIKSQDPLKIVIRGRKKSPKEQKLRRERKRPRLKLLDGRVPLKAQEPQKAI